MSELNLRVANFLKLFSMLIVLGSLMYMYAYVNDRMEFLNHSPGWLMNVSKSHIFYSALVVFAVFNLLLNVALSIYKSADGYDENSLLFRSKLQKERLIMWFTYLLAAINLLIGCSIIYVAFIRINDVNNHMDYIYIPGFGVLILIGVVAALFTTILKK